MSEDCSLRSTGTERGKCFVSTSSKKVSLCAELYFIIILRHKIHISILTMTYLIKCTIQIAAIRRFCETVFDNSLL